MNSRTDSGWLFQNPPENDFPIGGPWVPPTPGNPILPRSNVGSVPFDRFGNQQGRPNWQDLVGIPDRHLQGTMSSGGIGRNFDLIQMMGQNGNSCESSFPQTGKGFFDQNAGSYAKSLGSGNAAWNNNPLAELFASAGPANGTSSRNMNAVADAPAILDSYSQVDSSWTEGNFTSLLLGGENANLGLSNWINADGLLQMSSDGFPVPCRPNYNINSPPRSEADATSSTTNSFPFAPVTPDHTKQLENHRHPNISVDESSSQEKDRLENFLTSVGSETIGNHCSELLQNIVDSSSAPVSTTLTEKNNFEGGDQGIDLNKTPQQKTPKRRKHRPKVIVEGKPKRARKPKSPKNTDSKENPSGKRKYVRKKKLESTETPQMEVVNEATVLTSESNAKSCRRKLDFDVENKNVESQEKAATTAMKIHQENRPAFNLNLDPQATELCNRTTNVAEAGSTCSLTQQAGSSLTHSMNQMPTESLSLAERCASAASPAAIKYNALNVIARCVSMRNASGYQLSNKNGFLHDHQHHLQGQLNRNISQAHSAHVNLEETRKMTWQNTPQMVERNVANSNEKRGLKREYFHAMKQAGPADYQRAFPFLLQDTCQVNDRNRNSHNFGTGYSEPYEKDRMENGFHTTPCVGVVRDGLKQVGTEGRRSVCTNGTPFDSRISESYLRGDITPKKLKHGITGTSADGWSPSMTSEHNIQKQLRASELHSYTQKIPEKRPGGSTQVHDITSLSVLANSHLLSSTPPKKAPTSCYEQGVESFCANMLVKTQNMAPTSSNMVSSPVNKMILQEHKVSSRDYRQSSIKKRGQARKQQYSDPIHEITCRLQGLNISGSGKETDGQEKNALVLYKGVGTIVPYERFDLIKKHKPRPKVDLDPETNRIWKLLMGKEGNEGTGVEDKDKEKWWEEERKVFRGRADSFIARMHLVQGDRRFSQWKGSVVDSVIGVFLTQNVSDHLSSSAFMSLAARFPLQSTYTDLTCYQSGTHTLAEEPKIQILEPDGTISYFEKLAREPDYKQGPVIYQEPSEARTKTPNSGTGRTSLATECIGIVEEKATSSQNSSDFFILQVNKEIQSCPRSNSEAEVSIHRWKSNMMHGHPTLPHTRTTSFPILPNPVSGNLCFDDRSTHWHKQAEDVHSNSKIPRMETFNNQNISSTLTHTISSNISHKQGSVVPPSHFRLLMNPDLEARDVGCFGRFPEESISSFPSTASGITKGKGIDYTSSHTGHTAERLSETTMIQEPIVGPSAFLAKHQTRRENTFTSVPYKGKDQLSLSTHQEEMSVKELVRPTEAVSVRQSGTRNQVLNDPGYRGEGFGWEVRNTVGDKQKFLENKAVEANAKNQVYYSVETSTGMSSNMRNGRKVKAEGEKSESFDWDSLRKVAQANGRRTERNKDAMDSMNYDGLRSADVSEISNAIKERGMNNMLADRIKDFLDRLVREHGSIDLEWLRDVPPEKAKDYLLSIRGLGLKSVECVRLLTLHHLAFPVDTNVGRIAVRLGWVPLQPLPESLQLHLLELYPMLESIQKYLWPRLCKLDQRTLYELHYQMITFGKVFCTKSKPNCNACPMRGECRHFASAFASARLALPGPEEKSIVSSTIPIATDRNLAVAIKPVPILPAGISESKAISSVFGNSEPIVEEPATPEPEAVEVTQSDIEDAFYEDPDEIPTIKLNAEEFVQNLHNYMQGNMELQESDFSKALVALNPEAASIPVPKLKNVSRLRTEHQVYELPDSHPLLKGMDKREPDDPSPYLLAIWTPGETANSVQPPEGSCGSQESGKLCNEKTCFSCNSVREANAQTVRATILIPCRTAMRGSFPLNGTYFQVNEMFAEHESSLRPIDVPRAWLWNLPRRTVYFGTSVSTIFKGLTTEGIQYCFWRGFVCVRGFDQKTRAPRPLMARLHFPASKLAKSKNEDQ